MKITNLFKTLCLLFFVVGPILPTFIVSAFLSRSVTHFQENETSFGKQSLNTKKREEVKDQVHTSKNKTADDKQVLSDKDKTSVLLFESPAGMAIDRQDNIVYVTNASGHSVSGCEVDQYGNFSNCIKNRSGEGTSLQSFYYPSGIAITNDSKRIYVTNRIGGRNSVSSCVVSAGGAVKWCKKYSPKMPDNKKKSMFMMPMGIALSPDNKTLFVASGGNYDPGTAHVTACSVSDDGDIFRCHDTGADHNLLAISGGMTLGKVYGKTFAFIANFHNSTVTSCTVDLSGGLFKNCVNSSRKNWLKNPANVAVDDSAGNAYVANFGSESLVSLCKISPDNGVLDHCVDTGGQKFHSPYGIMLDHAGKFLYVANGESGSVTRCLVDRNNGGKLIQCRDVHPALLMKMGKEVVSTANLKIGSEGDFTLYNAGDDIDHVRLTVPQAQEYLFSSKSTCPLNRMGKLKAGESCKIHYNIPESSSRQIFDISLTAGTSKVPWVVLPVTLSDIEVTHNGKPSDRNRMVLYRGEIKGHFSFRSPRGIKNFHIEMSDPALLKYITGDCVKWKTLKPGQMCTLKYNVHDELGAGRYFVNLKSGKQTVFSIPLKISVTNVLGFRSNFIGVPDYNRVDIIFKNQLNRPMTNIKISSPTKDYFQILDNNCAKLTRLDSGKTCTVSVFARFNMENAKTGFKPGPQTLADIVDVSSDQFESFILGLNVQPVPTTTVTLAASVGIGIVVRPTYTPVQPDGYSFRQVKRGNIAVGSSETLENMPMFNDLDAVNKLRGTRWFPKNMFTFISMYGYATIHRHKKVTITKKYQFVTCSGSVFSWKCK